MVGWLVGAFYLGGITGGVLSFGPMLLLLLQQAQQPLVCFVEGSVLLKQQLNLEWKHARNF